MGIKLQLICTCGKGTFKLRRDESIEAQIEEKLQLCEICIRNQYDDPYMCDECSLKCEYCSNWFCPEHVNDKYKICIDCQDDKWLCDVCDNYKDETFAFKEQNTCQDCIDDYRNENEFECEGCNEWIDNEKMSKNSNICEECYENQEDPDESPLPFFSYRTDLD